jgi:glycine/D-amino acid oxidase-like deaminating enzyme
MDINLNTFSPISSLHPQTRSLPAFPAGTRVTIIGAGAFGGWTALFLLRAGYRVTLIDAWGAGNSRSSSGDETRVIRSTYGANEFYFDLNVRALELWKENEKHFGQRIFHNTGVLWLCYNETTPLVDDSIPFAKKHRQEYEFLDNNSLIRRYPILNTSDLTHAYFDRFGGYLKAREGTIAVTKAFIREGGEFIQQAVSPGPITKGVLKEIRFANGRRHVSDIYIFACGPWLGSLFPNELENVITCSKQEVYYFGIPSATASQFDSFPVWIDADGKDFYYGIAGNAARGFKIGVDRRGENFDPTTSDRKLNDDTLERARSFLAHRFPALKNAPLIENRVCAYENSPDGNFIFDLLPATANTFILGAGSGHGFKHGPALGELVARILSGNQPYPSIFSIRK